MNEVNPKLNALEKKLNNRITAIDAKHTGTIKKLFEEWDLRNTETKNLIFGLCNGHDQHDKQQKTIQTPSTTSKNDTGVPGVTQ